MDAKEVMSRRARRTCLTALTVALRAQVMILVTGQPKALALAKCIEEGVLPRDRRISLSFDPR